MSNLDDLDKLLIECSEKLVDCSSIISEIPVEPRRENIHRIGKALAELGEIRDEIYKKRPELKPEKWDEAPSEDDYAEMLQEALKQANEHLLAGNPKRAKETYESFIFIGPCEKYMSLAQDKMNEVVADYDV